MWKGSLLKISYLLKNKKKVYTFDVDWFYYIKCVDIVST